MMSIHRRWLAVGSMMVWLLAIGPVGASADTLQIVLLPPSASPQAGREMVFTVLVTNPADTLRPVKLPNRLICRLKAGKDMVEAPAESLPPGAAETVEIGAGQFLKREYRLLVPASVSGWVVLQVPRFQHASVAVEVQGARSTAPTADAGGGRPEKPTLQTFDEITGLYQPYIRNVGAHEPTYFLVGVNPEKSKFQISFKYQFFNSDGPLAKNHPWVAGFNFGYTQTSFWDLKSASKPFQDTSYKPELFFRTPNIAAGGKRLRGLFFQTGFRHESNGRGGVDSRSTNTVYLRPMFVFYRETSQLGLLVAPKVWLYVGNDDDTNPDLDRYRGYADLEIKAGKADGLVFRSVVGWAKEGGSVQLDLTYPLHRIAFGNIDVYLQVQYASRLAESLLNFRQRTEALRLGVAIIR